MIFRIYVIFTYICICNVYVTYDGCFVAAAFWYNCCLVIYYFLCLFSSLLETFRLNTYIYSHQMPIHSFSFLFVFIFVYCVACASSSPSIAKRRHRLWCPQSTQINININNKYEYLISNLFFAASFFITSSLSLTENKLLSKNLPLWGPLAGHFFYIWFLFSSVDVLRLFTGRCKHSSFFLKTNI